MMKEVCNDSEVKFQAAGFVLRLPYHHYLIVARHASLMYALRTPRR